MFQIQGEENSHPEKMKKEDKQEEDRVRIENERVTKSGEINRVAATKVGGFKRRCFFAGKEMKCFVSQIVII